jgi:hypothetical protein
MTDSLANAYIMDESFKTAVNQVITDIPNRFIDEDIAHAAQVLFCDFGAGANFTELEKIIVIIYDHALPTGARNDKMVSLMAHIVRPKPARFDLIFEGREEQAETLAYGFILGKMCFKTYFELAEVWDRRPFDIVAEFADNYEELQIPEAEIRAHVRLVLVMAAEGERLFRKDNFDLFVRFVMDHSHILDSVKMLQNVSQRAEGESRDVQFMVAGLLSVAIERRGGG